MSVWTNLTKNVATWANQVKHALYYYLLKEDGFYLLLEDGGKIILEEYGWNNATKHSATWANQTKN